MAAKLKISADTSEIKKSLLDAGREIKRMGQGTKVSLFTAAERRFLKSELGEELKKMKSRFNDNKKIITDMVAEQKKMVKGSQEELKIRRDIMNAYKTQSQLSREMAQVQQTRGQVGGIGGGRMPRGTGGRMGGMLGKFGRAGIIGGVLGVGALAISRGQQAAQQYRQGRGARVALSGLGVEDENFGSPRQLAEAGMTEQDMIRRRVQSTRALGRGNAGNDDILQQARFERAFGLESGQMTNIATGLRAGFGGQGANEAQMKLQASVFASGMEDAIAPYLETMAGFLADINKNGMTQTDEMINAISQITKEGARTPEQIANAFKNIDQAMRGATGEKSAFLQTAFARAGIGGGTIGGTKLAIQSGGLFGLNQDELKKRGYSPQLLKQMEGAGFFTGASTRAGAMTEQFKRSAGMKPGQSFNDASVAQMIGLTDMANQLFGTQGIEGFDQLKLMEKLQNKEISKEEFEKQSKEIKEKKNPQVERLEKINSTLAGQSQIIELTNTNLMEQLGKQTNKMIDKLTDIENAILGRVVGEEEDVSGSDVMGNVLMGAGAGAVTGAGIGSVIPGVGTAIGGAVGGLVGAGVGYFMGDEDRNMKKAGNMPAEGSGVLRPEAQQSTIADEITKGFSRVNIQNQNVNNNKADIKIQMGDGKVMNRTHK